MVSKKILFVSGLFVSVNMSVLSTTDLVFRRHVPVMTPGPIAPAQKPSLTELVAALNPGEQLAVQDLRSRISELDAGTASCSRDDPYRDWASFFLDGNPVVLKAFNFGPDKAHKNDDDTLAFIFNITTESYFIAAPIRENPPYSIKSSLSVYHKPKPTPKPRYLMILLDLLAAMHAIHKSSTRETFCYDEEARNKIKSMTGVHFSIFMDLPEGEVNLQMGKLSAIIVGSAFLELGIPHKEIDLGEGLIERYIQDGRVVKELTVVIPRSVELAFRFRPEFSQHTAAFLNYVLATFGEYIPRIVESLRD